MVVKNYSRKTQKQKNRKRHSIHVHVGKHHDVPTFPFAEIRKKFQFLSLLTSPEAISVLEILRIECERVGDMSLFHTGASKHLKLEEFDSAQQQASVQVCIIMYVWLQPTFVLCSQVCFPSLPFQAARKGEKLILQPESRGDHSGLNLGYCSYSASL